MDTQRKVKFRDIVEINPRESIPKSTPAKYVAMENLLPFTKKISKYEIKKYKGGAKFRNGDTLLARITPCLENGKTAFVDILKENEIGFGSTEYIVIRKKTKITDSHYVYYLSTSPRFRDSAIKLMSGTSGRQRIEIEGLKNLNISLPPLSEQKRIANILSSFDNKIEILKKENKILENIAENIFKEWFVKYNFPNKEGKPYKDSGGKMIDSELGPIPEGWRVGKLGEICTILGSGGTPTTTKSEYYGNKYNWVTTKELQDTFLLSSEKKISEEGLNNSSVKLFPKNSVLIAIYAAPTVGRLGILSNKGTFNQATCGLYANENSSNEFLFLYLLNERRNLNNLASGAAQQNLNVGIIKNYLVPYPDRITNKKFTDMVKPLFNRIEINIKEQDNLSKQKDKLLNKLLK